MVIFSLSLSKIKDPTIFHHTPNYVSHVTVRKVRREPYVIVSHLHPIRVMFLTSVSLFIPSSVYR